MKKKRMINRKIIAVLFVFIIAATGCSGKAFETIITDGDNLFDAPEFPGILSITSVDGSYGVGDVIDITVTFSDTVTFNCDGCAAGECKVEITLNTDPEQMITFYPVTGPITSITVTYTIQDGDNVADLAVSSISMPCGSLIDGNGNPVDFDLPPDDNLDDNNDVIIDTTPPEVSSITTSTLDGTYATNQSINIEVEFTEPVTFTTENTGEVLQVSLNTGHNIELSPVVGDNSRYTATYDISAGDSTLDEPGQSLRVTGIVLNGGTLQDDAGNDAILDLPVVNSLEGIIINAVNPEIVSIDTPVGDGTYGIGDEIAITITFSDTLYLDCEGCAEGTCVMEVELNTGDTITIDPMPASFITITATYIISEGDNVENLAVTSISMQCGTLVDDLGNEPVFDLPDDEENDLDDNSGITIDTTAPLISSITSSSENSITYGLGDTINVTVTFNETVWLEDGTLQITLDTGAVVTIGAFNNSNTATGIYTVGLNETSNDLDSTGIELSVGGTLRDAGQNIVADYSLDGMETIADGSQIVVDGIVPRIASITSTSDDTLYGLGGNINITVTFDESVTLSGGSLDVTLDTGTTDRVVSISSIDNTTTASGIYTVQEGDTSSDLSVDSIAVNGSVQDAAGNGINTALPSVPNRLIDNKNISVDGIVPRIVSITSTSDDSLYGLGGDINITVTFNEPVSLSSGSLDITLDTTRVVSIPAVSIVGTDSASGTYTVQAGDTSSQLAVSGLVVTGGNLQDAAGNNCNQALPLLPNRLTDTSSISVDGIVPSIVSITSTEANTTYGLGDSINVTVTFDEPVSLAGGPLQVTLDTGAVVSIGAFSNSDTAAGVYIVGLNEISSDLDSTGIALSGGTLRDAALNDVADYALGVKETIADGSQIVVDGVLPAVVSAVTLDVDRNGRIDHYRLTFNKNVVDDTFPGYAENAVGDIQTASGWLVDGYMNVGLAHGSAAPESDTVNDTILYLQFQEGSGYDTNATPDIITGGAPGLADGAGNIIAQVQTSDITEADGARPVLVSASGKTGFNTLSINFSEPVDSDGGVCDGTSPLEAGDFSYTNTSDNDASAVSGISEDDDNACDSSVIVTLNALLSTNDIFTDLIYATADSILDNSGNAAATDIVLISGSVSPYVLSVFAVGETALRIIFSKPVNSSQATNADNYSLAEDNDPGADCAAITIGSISQVDGDGRIYEVTNTGVQCSDVTYKLEVTGTISDADDASLELVDPKFGTFLGNEQLKVVAGTCEDTRTSMLVIYNKPVKDGTGADGAENTANYFFTGPNDLGTVESAARLDNGSENEVRISHNTGADPDKEQKQVGYTVIVANGVDGDGFDNGTNTIVTDTAILGYEESIQPSPNDRIFWNGCGDAVESFGDGPIARDPFGDGSDFGYLASYGEKVYIGPNSRGNSATRFEPDGTNPVPVRFNFQKDTTGDSHQNIDTEWGDGYAVPPYVTIGFSGCNVNDADPYSGCGPDNEDGRGVFSVGELQNTDYIFLGGARTTPDGSDYYFDYIYFSKDLDTTLNFQYIDMGNITGTVTSGLSAISVLKDRVFVGLAKRNTNESNAPDFGKINFSTGSGEGDCSLIPDGNGAYNCDAEDNTNGRRFFINLLPYFGGGTQSTVGDDNDSPNWAYIAGVDSMFVFHDRIYAANGGHNKVGHNGSIIRSLNDNPAQCSNDGAETGLCPFLGSGCDEDTCSNAWTEIGPRSHPEWHNTDGGTNRFSLELTALADLTAGDKAFAQFAKFEGNLYVTRTACGVSESGSTDFDSSLHYQPGCTCDTSADPDCDKYSNRETQLWKCIPGTTGNATECDSGDWSLVDGIGGTADGLTNFGDGNNDSLTMLVKNGDRLYLGFDNHVDGIEIWRSKEGVLNPATEDDFELVSDSGLGNGSSSGDVQEIYSSISIEHNSYSYVYVSAGKYGVPVAVFRHRN